MSVERTRAIILRRTNYGEADRVLRMITPLGQRSVIAKGVRREKANWPEESSYLRLVTSLLRGRGELGILTSARLVQFYQHILNDYDRLQFGYESINLVAKASEMIDEPSGMVSSVRCIWGLMCRRFRCSSSKRGFMFTMQS